MYIEVPSVKAKREGLKRQEFFLEHFNIFSKKSLTILFTTLNYKIIKISDIKEVNNKYTLRAIIEKNNLENIFDKLFPINRSIMGKGFRKSLEIITEGLNFKKN